MHFESPAICPSTGEAMLPSAGLSVSLPSSKKSSPRKHPVSPPPPPANSNVVHSPDSPQVASDLDSNSSSSSDSVAEVRGAVGGISLGGYQERDRVAAVAGQWPPEYEQAAANDRHRPSPHHQVMAARADRIPVRSARQLRNEVSVGDLDHFFLDDRNEDGGDRMQGMRVNEAVSGARSRNAAAAAAGRSGHGERRKSVEKRLSPKRGRDGEM